jgi:DNA-binding beta-propeller fold protein YncE
MLAALFWLVMAAAAQAGEKAPRHCLKPEAQSLLEQGMALQAELESESALAKYKTCERIEPDCMACVYESGWSYWKEGHWDEVVKAWEKVAAKDPSDSDILQFLPTAKENLALVKVKKAPATFVSGVKLGTKSTPTDSPLSLLFLGRRQSYNRAPENPLDIFDSDIQSPKSVHFSPDGKKVYVNSLEGGRTAIYDALGTEKLGLIKHKFTEAESSLFLEGKKAPWGYSFPRSIAKPNEFLGKPVEIEHTHKGKFLWIPYYRRSFDANGSLPSALAIVDAASAAIVRVMAVGPIAKYVKRSNTGRWLAVSHWGDNTVGLIDVRGQDPSKFKHDDLLVVEKQVQPKDMKGDRDKNCGFCVRGLAFSENDRYLFVTRMKGGGIAVFHLDPKDKIKPAYLGTIFGLVPGPRDIEINSRGQLYVSCNASGVVLSLPWRKLVDALAELKPETPVAERSIHVKASELGAVKTYVGIGARSLRLSADEKTIFVTVNQSSELVGLDAESMQIEARVPVDSYPVGLELSPDGAEVWVTSQGRDAKGGNSVGIFQARYKMQEIVPAAHGMPK